MQINLHYICEFLIFAQILSTITKKQTLLHAWSVSFQSKLMPQLGLFWNRLYYSLDHFELVIMLQLGCFWNSLDHFELVIMPQLGCFRNGLDHFETDHITVWNILNLLCELIVVLLSCRTCWKFRQVAPWVSTPSYSSSPSRYRSSTDGLFLALKRTIIASSLPLLNSRFQQVPPEVPSRQLFTGTLVLSYCKGWI